jgi:seryl-tRNA synthetase
MAVIPNLPHDDVPVGADENDNVLLKSHGEKPVFDFNEKPKEHYELGEAIGDMDFAALPPSCPDRASSCSRASLRGWNGPSASS